MKRLSRCASAARAAQNRRRAGGLAIALALLAVVGFGWKMWSLYGRLQAVQADLRTIEQRGRPDVRALPALAPLLSQLRGDTAALRAEAAPLLPIARRLDGLPRYGAVLAAAEPLLDLLGDLSGAADETCAALCPIISAGDQALVPGSDLTARLSLAHPRLLAARAALEEASAAQARVAGQPLSPWLVRRLRQVDALLPQAKEALDLAIAAPELLGAHGPRSYLLLAQDVNEQRATGGFIGGAGVLTLDGGKIAELSLRDSYSMDDLAHQAYPPPPEPLRRYLGLQLWLFRDANWTADFPSAARQALDFYQLGQGRDLDGAIAFDQTALKLLLDATGPIQLEDSQRVSGDNVVQYMYRQYSLNFPRRRKNFMEPLGRALARKLAGGLDLPRLAALASAVGRALEERHLLLYLEQPQAAGVLARRGWDGAVRPGTQDFLMVVDSNVGYNKVFPNIAETISYTVDLSDPTAPLATLTVRHANRQPRARECSWRQRDRIKRYEDYFVDCYWDYLRALVPSDSRLVAAQTHPTPGAWLFSGAPEDGAAALAPGEGGSFSLETLVVVPMGDERATTFRYRLPASALARGSDGWRYRLALQKQPGTQAVPISVRVRLPRHARLSGSSLAPEARQVSDSVVYTLRLDRDKLIELSFS